MNKKAFPTTSNFDEFVGMDLRVYLAAKAMQGILANPNCSILTESLVAGAYQIADAMMKARGEA